MSLQTYRKTGYYSQDDNQVHSTDTICISVGRDFCTSILQGHYCLYNCDIASVIINKGRNNLGSKLIRILTELQSLSRLKKYLLEAHGLESCLE